MDRDHPALVKNGGAYANTIRDMSVKMDKTVGDALNPLGDETAVVVMSDHGFKPFRRRVDLNAWLLANGYLKLKEDAMTSDRQYPADVDWSRTKAYTIGLAGFFITQRGHEVQGIVEAGEESKQFVKN